VEKFAGQWLGSFEGTNSGVALLDLDLEDDWLEGTVYAFDASNEVPSSFAALVTTPIGDNLHFNVKPNPIHPVYARIANSDDFPEISFPSSLKVNLTLTNKKMSGTWESDIDTKGNVTLFASEASEPSVYKSDPEIWDWDKFIIEIAKLANEPYRYIFRGQSAPWRLRSSFHRTQRKDLWRYWDEDIPRLRLASIGKTSHLFDPSSPEQNGAFLHLLQHHGYPTPMLDWTYSPYIAAYFAYSSATSREPDQPPVRVFMFDAQAWKEDFNQVLNITLCRPHFSLLEPLAIGNDCALPQQSLASVSNIDDIESYIRFQEDQLGKSYLKVFDLPASEGSAVLRHLGLMGISPGSLFPGLDGLCKEYRDRHFGRIG
jgi:hypothetical protein